MNKSFFDAIRSGDAAVVRNMVESDPSLLNDRDESGLGAFTVARYSRQDGIASMLLEKGVQLDIFAACMAGVDSRIIELLAADRELVDSLSHDGWTPLHLAAYFGHVTAAEILLANGAHVDARSRNNMNNLPLHAAVAGKHAAAVAVLLAHGSDVNAAQHGGWTALQGAAQSGDAETVKLLLLASGADVNARAENNQTALDLALTHGHHEIVALLEQHGAK